jgi:hypothetical protein
LNLKSHHESLNEIACFLNGTVVDGVLRHFHFHTAQFGVHSNLKLEVFHNGFHDVFPVLFERGEAMRGNADLSNFFGILRVRGRKVGV